MRTFKETIRLIKVDRQAYGEPFLKCLLFVPGFKYQFHQRWCYYFSQKKWMLPIFALYWLYLKHLTYLLGIQMGWNFEMPEHFVIGHFGGITFF